MNLEYIIVQAGGKGTRMEYLTKNKPKSLVPINNLPMLFHLFKKYPDKKYIIIGDYKIDVLKKYLAAFAKVKYLIVDSSEYKGTCAGLFQSLKYIPSNKRFMLIWSDLILPKEFLMPEDNENYVGISKDFKCRWKYENGIFEEEASENQGVAGLFIFKNKDIIKNVLYEGEFVRWLSTQNIEFKELPLIKTKEYGLLSEYKKLEVSKCRPFNSMIVKDDRIIKEGIDEQGKLLAQREVKWYSKIKEYGYTNIPKIYDINPIIMEKINGKNIYEYNFSVDEKKSVLKNIINTLKDLHNIDSIETDYYSMKENYLTKTLERLEKVRDLIPFANEKYITINGRKCRNVFFFKDEFENKVNSLDTKEFKIIHGDCTFSNLMLRNEDLSPVLIDPRGYFGQTELFGDPIYDWAKLYYSIKGNYDKFNLKRFQLEILENGANISVESNNWEDTEEYFFELLKDEVDKENIKLIHAIIWLSLTTYAWEDYDSICGAFYIGLYYLEEVL